VTGITNLRIRVVVAVMLASTVAFALVGVTRSHAAATAKARTYVAIGNTLAGPLVVDNRGYVLFTKERRRQDRCAKIKGCVIDWPPVTTIGKPIAGPGINPALLGSIPYKGKLRQVTYAGYPLDAYKFAASAESSVTNIGIKQFGSPWEALTAAGKTVG
jgi:predicted lipoprotein with Yx(FWY)xxD motif